MQIYFVRIHIQILKIKTLFNCIIISFLGVNDQSKESKHKRNIFGSLFRKKKGKYDVKTSQIAQDTQMSSSKIIKQNK